MKERFARIKQIRCLACQIESTDETFACGPTEAHHLNLGGMAGQKRRGDDETVALGAWHHRGVPLRGMTVGEMSFKYGPSLAISSKLFRFTYGSDDQLLALTNLKLERVA